MFKDDYKKYNDDIKVDPELKARVMEAVDKAESTPEKKIHGKMFYFTRIGIPVAACLVVVALVANVFLHRDVRITNGKISTFDSYGEIYNSIERSMLESYDNISFYGSNSSVGDFLIYETATDVNSSSTTNRGYSDTNVQVEGVDEADIVKTDGEYIYIFSYNRVKIVKAAGAETELVSKIKIGSDPDYGKADMYLYEDSLIVIYSDKNNDTYFTRTEVYDVKDPEHPEHKGSLSQQGEYISSRMIDGKIYVFSTFRIYVKNAVKDEYKTYIPMLEVNGAESFVSAENIYCCTSVSSQPGRSHLVISAVDTEHPEEFLDTKSVLGANGDIYMNQANLFVSMYNGYCETDSSEVTDSTAIIKFRVEDGVLTESASCVIPGVLLNQFSMDEYNGYLRIAATVSSYEVRSQLGRDGALPVMYEYFYEISESNSIYVLDEKLEEVSSITGLAENESIYSVRFDGDKGYVVTFEQVDPLFEIDLSNPEKPVVTDALKITGVSRYLHVFKDDLLLGIGSNGTENGLNGQLKLSMFKINSEGENEEVHKYVTRHDTSSPAFYNHKAILIDAEKNIIGFPMSSIIDEANHKVVFGECYAIFSYNDETGFKQELVIAEGDYENAYDDTVRGLYIDDVLYIAFANRSLHAYDIETFELIAEIDIY